MQIYCTSKKKEEYQISLTKEEIDAIPIILNMAGIYLWELYNKKEGDKFYEQHKKNIDMINEYHNKGYQGILAVGSLMEAKAKLVMKDKELNDVLEPYMNKIT